jgi:16S rRNA (cytosine967-C5)-methyltransferase
MSHPPRRQGGSRPGRRRHPATRRPVLDGARLTAYDVLDGVSSRDAYANLLLPQLLRERRLDERDAAFATQLAYGTLRAQGTLDAILAGLVSRPLDELDPRVLDLLRLGAYQLIDLRVPSHAAVDTSVDLTRAIVGSGASGLVNAVLRKVAAGGDRAAWLETLGAAGDERLALATNHPRWIVDAWRDSLGREDELEPALRADDAAPEVHLVARRVDRTTLAEESGGQPGPWSPYAVRLTSGDPGRLRSIRSGDAAVQDEGSQLAALLLARAPLEGPDASWLDMCAGPGGKAGLLAAVRPDGVRLTAADRAPHRADLVRTALAGADDIEVVVADGTAPSWAPGSFDRVLLDAPCSGLGTLRRRADARWRIEADAVGRLAELQRELLAAATNLVRPGGTLVYSVCTLTTAEGPDVAATLDWPMLDAPGAPWEPWGSGAKLLPQAEGTDGMFLARWNRPADS